MHGKLSFIERALGINKARELYQQVEKCQLSQRELAEHLKNDGYPINQSHISRMEQALEYLLPLHPRGALRRNGPLAGGKAAVIAGGIITSLAASRS
nr:hypothetical protein [Salmonella enterica]